MRSGIITLIISFLYLQSIAQKDALGSWITLNTKWEYSDKWSGYGELQLRGLSLYDRFFYHEIKTGLTYSPWKNISFTLGTGFYNTFNEGIKYDNYSKVKEWRIWEQFILKQNIYLLDVEHRIRIEQKFTDNYAGRYRYRLNVNLPLNDTKMNPGAIYASVYDEIFLVDKIPHFARNRFFVGGGYIFPKQFNLQAGILNQVDYSKSTTRNKYYLFTSLTYNISGSKHTNTDD